MLNLRIKLAVLLNKIGLYIPFEINLNERWVVRLL